MTFAPGSIVKRPLKHGFWGLFYKHMGIYVGDGMVIHFSGESKKTHNVTVRRDSLQQFAAGHTVKLHAGPNNPAHARAVCEEAERLYLDRDNPYDQQYDFVSQNCEDFCVHCYTVPYAP